MAIVKLNGLVVGAVSMTEYTVQKLESAGFTVIIPQYKGVCPLFLLADRLRALYAQPVRKVYLWDAQQKIEQMFIVQSAQK